MWKTRRIYARMIFDGDVVIIGGNDYVVTGIHANADRNTVLTFRQDFEDGTERKIVLVVPASEILQIKTRRQ